MRLYRHYKNKFYKYLDTVRHSETREELVLYETRYESPGGKTWVRPKDMFFENVTIDGKVKPRFARVEVQLDYADRLESLVEAESLLQLLFSDFDREWFESRLREETRPLFLTARIDEQLVGVKIGFQKEDGSFHSWMGGVHPEFRGVGLAQMLMQAQHEWLRSQKIKRVTTATLSTNQEMLVLNLKSGFQISGTEPSRRGLKVLLEKHL